MSALLPVTWLIDTAAALTLLVALVLLLRAPVARAFGAGMAYALWLLPLARAVMPGITLTADAPAPAAPADAVLVVVGNAAPAALDPLPWPIALWLCGALVVAAQATLATMRLRSAVMADSRIIEQRGRIAIRLSRAVDGPVAMGILRPMVVLPHDFSTRFGLAEQRQVIAHEMAHHEGHDLAITLAAFALLALNWFNPIAWAGWRAFRQDQEAACDARTLTSLGIQTGDERATYGRAIATAVTGHRFRPAAALTLAMGEKSALMHRLRSLAMTDISKNRRRVGRAMVLGAALLTLPLTASVSYAVEQSSPPVPPVPPTTPEPPHVTVISDDARHERRIERDGRTIILRSNQPLSEAEVEAAVSEGEAAARAASAEPGQPGQRRVIIRTSTSESRTSSSSSSSSSSASADPVGGTAEIVTSRNPAGGPTRSESTFVFGGQAASGADMRTSCDNDPNATRIERQFGSGENQDVLRIIRCGDNNGPAARIEALRRARTAMGSRPANGHMPADVHARMIAELDRMIAEEERAPGQ